MTSTFLKNKAKDFFDGKKAKVLVLQRNIGGDEIAQGEIVTLTGRSPRDKTSLSIKSDTGIIINSVWCEQLELITE
ncbi:hypothetical protein [Flavobacterium sp.]|uniref:hypothetical protein n=1 Tax=Flavobacterium sp. TaxID=239 RepID=UPI003262EC4F